VGYLIAIYYKFTAESAGKIILKIGQQLAKIWARVECILTDGVSAVSAIIRNHDDNDADDDDDSPLCSTGLPSVET